ncbi:MAG: hypothetical protein ACYCSH_00715 [Acidithiobacillus sp.]|uniref:hypothetical protein n=1 Tax=Acidithiobacillus ferrooxidans TaxID=920 RepID=UPI0013D2AC3B|nr:hypothetical protein [Acidithiobacillus ferrooxidans]
MNPLACRNPLGNKGHSLTEDQDVEDLLPYIRNFLSLPPSKRWSRCQVTEEQTHVHQIRGYGGRGTWELFRAAALAEHQWAAQKTRRSRKSTCLESWSILNKHDAPSGWSALDEGDLYVEDADAHGSISECITVRDRNRGDGIAGFVSYRVSMYADFATPRKKQRQRTISFNFCVDVEQIYVRPSYRRKKFGLALCYGLSERLRTIVEHGLSTQPAGHKFLVEDVTLYADCYSEEGYDWMASLETAVDLWVADALISGDCGDAFESTTVTGDFGM